MSMYNELKPYVEYLHSIRKLKTYISFDFKFPMKWIIPKSVSDDGDILPFNTDDDTKGISFVSMIDEENIEKILSKVSKVIKVNQEKELKEKLFKEMIDKLKTTFESNNLEKLQKLNFEFQDEMKNQKTFEYEKQESDDVELVRE